MPPVPLLVVLDLVGTFTFALNGALTAVRAARLDIVGVLALGVITALGGGILRDTLLGAVPPATLGDWRYLAVAFGGASLAFLLSRWLDPLTMLITLCDALGLSVFAVMGAAKALDWGLGPASAVILGAMTGVGGGTIRDVLIRSIPTVLRSELYAIPALLGAALMMLAIELGMGGLPSALGAAACCFTLRMVGVRFHLNAPLPPGRAVPE